MPAMRPLAGPAPPVSRPALIALAWRWPAVAPAVQAQSLKELYEAARAYDAGYLRGAGAGASRPTTAWRSRGAGPAFGSAQQRGATSRACRPAGPAAAATAIRSAPRQRRYPLINRSQRRHHRPGRKSLESAKGRPRDRRAGPDRARGAGLLRRAGGAGHAGHAARQQGRHHRAAGLGQAQLRGRHRHHHRHARGAGPLRPGDGRRDRGRQRPAHQAHRARPAGGPQRH
jgi:hypothetical protein